MALIPTWQANTDSWPLVLVHVVGAQPDVAPDFDSFLSTMDHLIALEGRCAVVMDLQGAKPDAARRQKMIAELRGRWGDIQRDTIAVGIVAPNAIQRSVYTAFTWFYSFSCPVKIFEYRTQAVLWATDRLAEAGLDVARA